MKCTLFGKSLANEQPYTAVICVTEKKKSMQNYDTLKLEPVNYVEVMIELHNGHFYRVNKMKDYSFLTKGSVDLYLFSQIAFNHETEDKAHLNEQIKKSIDIAEKILDTQRVAGTKKQEEALMSCPDKGDYKKECAFLEEKGILKDRGSHYGKSWLYRPSTIDYKKELFTIIPEKYWKV